VPPWREEADVAPLFDTGAHTVSCFEQHEVDPALGEIGRGGEADGAGADDGHRKPLEAMGNPGRRSEVEEGHP
jgi:hypothetical protein